MVDTPGFGDGDGEMSELIDNMLDVLKNQVKSVEVIVLLIKGTENRFNEALQKMLLCSNSVMEEVCNKWTLFEENSGKDDSRPATPVVPANGHQLYTVSDVLYSWRKM